MVSALVQTFGEPTSRPNRVHLATYRVKLAPSGELNGNDRPDFNDLQNDASDQTAFESESRQAFSRI